MTRLPQPPIELAVSLDQNGLPVRFLWGTTRYTVVRIVEQWQVDTDWWCENPVSYRAYGLLTSAGVRFDIYFDHLQSGWFLDRIYD